MPQENTILPCMARCVDEICRLHCPSEQCSLLPAHAPSWCGGERGQSHGPTFLHSLGGNMLSQQLTEGSVSVLSQITIWPFQHYFLA